MKILLVTDLYPIGEEKITKALFYFVQEWQKLGHKVEVIRANFILNTLIRERKIIDEKIYTEHGTKIYNLNFHTPFWFNVYKKLPKDFSLKNYDVIISHMPCGALMANRLLEREKIKYICAVHCSDIKVLTSKKYLLFQNRLKQAYKQTDKIAARSPILKEKIEKLVPNNKTFIAYSGTNIEIIEKPFNKEKITITTIASLIKRKNVDVIINAVKNLNNVQLNIIGSGKEEKKLKKLAKNTNITFLGQLNRVLVIEQLKKSDIFVLLSNNETFGLAYLEAMATGNIVIGKINDGIDGIIKNKENGFLISATTEELINCIKTIKALNENELNEIKSNSKKTIENYTLEKASLNYLNKMNDFNKI